MKTSADPIPVVVVGGGSILLRDALPGASELVKPQHFAVANAIGAAIAQVGGEIDRIVALEGYDPCCGDRGSQAGGRSRKRSLPAPSAKGFASSTSRTSPLAYLAGRRDADPREGGRRPRPREGGRCGSWVRRSSRTSPSARRSSALAVAATRYIGKLLAQEAVRRYGPVEIVTVDEVPDEAFVVPSAMMGAPTVMVEKLPRGDRGRSTRSRRSAATWVASRRTRRRSRPAGSTRRRRSSSPRSSASHSSTPTGWAARSRRFR